MFFTDISYNCYTPETSSYLNILLEDPDLSSKILFGTDFHVVRLEKSEKEYSLGLRQLLGKSKYKFIASENPRKFLNSKKSIIPL